MLGGPWTTNRSMAERLSPFIVGSSAGETGYGISQGFSLAERALHLDGALWLL